MFKDKPVFTSVQDKFLRKKEGIGDIPIRGNFIITIKTNPYSKIISFYTSDEFNTQRIFSNIVRKHGNTSILR
jgi:hypothetical protein